MRVGDIVPSLDGYTDLPFPVALVVGSSWSMQEVPATEARSILTDAGFNPDGEPEYDRWYSVVKADEVRCFEGAWHSDASGKRWVDVLIYATSRACADSSLLAWGAHLLDEGSST